MTSLTSFQVIQPTFTIATAFAGGLLVIDIGAWHVVSMMFDRERLSPEPAVTDHRSQR
ncbi:MAG: hypothetical protein ACRDOH_12660 [Streptosporangiaceae bacterium]